MTWWRRLLQRGALEAQLDAELRDHLERQVADLVASGVPEPEARRQAALMLGGLEPTKEACRDARGTRWLHDVASDVHYALRLLRKSPGFSAVATLSLALAIGANVAVFSLLDAVFLRTLPVRAPHDLVLLAERAQDRDILSWSRTQYQAMAGAATLEGVCAFRPQMTFAVIGPASADAVSGQLVSGNCFELLGVRAALGRLLTPADDEATPAPAAIISYGFWERYFGGDPAAIGRTLRLKDRTFTVVGVTPRAFLGLEPGQPLDITLPLGQAALVLPRLATSPTVRWMRLIARTRPAVPRDRVAAELAHLSGAARVDTPSGAQGLNDLRRQFATPLRILALGVALLLVAACANLAALLLARGRSRDHELRLRAALGAGRGRLVRQLLTESLLLSSIAGAAGLALALPSARAVIALLSRGRAAIVLPPLLDARLVMFALAVTAASVLAFGVWPALAAARRESPQPLASRTTTAHGRRRTAVLVAAQTVVSAILLSGAMLFARSLTNLHGAELGFDKHGVLLAGVQPGLAGTARPLGQAFYRELLTRLSGEPGVRSVSLAMDVPFGGVSATAGVSVPGDPAAGDDQTMFNYVGPRFFETMRIPLIAGRDFQLDDDQRSRPVAIVSRSLAARCFPGGDAVGRQLATGGGKIVDVIGVSADVPYTSLRAPRERTIYRPYLQEAGGAALTLAIRTDLPPGAAADVLRRTVRDIAPAVPVAALSTLDARVDGSITSERLLANLSAFFAAMALLLVGIGIYGTLAYSIAQRTRELGVRLALGATRGDIGGMILRSALSPVCAGLAIGMPLTLATNRLAAGLLFGIAPWDPTAAASAIAVLLGAAATAAILPARQAVRADPLVALRQD